MEEWIIPIRQKSFAHEQCATRHELMLIHIQLTAHRDRPEYNEHQRADCDRNSDLFADNFRCNSGQLVRGLQVYVPWFSLAKNRRAYAHQRCAFLDCNRKILRHTHRELREINPKFGLQVITQLT